MIQFKINQNPQALFENLCICHNPYTGTRVIGNNPKFKRYVDKVKTDLTGRPAESIHYPVNVKCVFHVARERKVSISDLLQTVDGLLVKYQVVAANVSTIIAGHDGSRCVMDTQHYTEIFITPLEDSKTE